MVWNVFDIDPVTRLLYTRYNKLQQQVAILRSDLGYVLHTLSVRVWGTYYLVICFLKYSSWGLGCTFGSGVRQYIN